MLFAQRKLRQYFLNRKNQILNHIILFQYISKEVKLDIRNIDAL